MLWNGPFGVAGPAGFCAQKYKMNGGLDYICGFAIIPFVHSEGEPFVGNGELDKVTGWNACCLVRLFAF